MDVSLHNERTALSTARLAAVVIPDLEQLNALQPLGEELGAAARREIERDRLRAGKGDAAVVTGGANGPEQVVLLTLGSEHSGRIEAFRCAGAKIAATARRLRNHEVVLESGTLSAIELAAVVEGFTLGGYANDRYKAERNDPPSLAVVGVAGDDHADAVQRAVTVARATNWARDLCNAPGNKLPPPLVAEEAQMLVDQHEHLSIRVLDRAAIRDKGMGLIDAVGQGSPHEPRMIAIEWNPPAAATTLDSERTAFVGKAITFDSGGISLKPGRGMTEMRMDKGGGCAVLGAMRAIAELNVPQRVLGIIASAENMPDGGAYKPGDVITAFDGTTVEITNTDAEGRLVLGDGIAYARELGCARIVEASTLTGAMVVALGHHFAGLVGEPDSAWTNEVLAAAKASGDHCWPLPLHEAYKHCLDSDIADLVNSGPRYAGGLYAGWFLRHFAKDTPLCHLDIAGTGMLPKAQGCFNAKDATGFGVRLMTHLIESQGR